MRIDTAIERLTDRIVQRDHRICASKYGQRAIPRIVHCMLHNAQTVDLDNPWIVVLKAWIPCFARTIPGLPAIASCETKLGTEHGFRQLIYGYTDELEEFLIVLKYTSSSIIRTQRPHFIIIIYKIADLL